MIRNTDWRQVLVKEFDKPYWAALREFVAKERSTCEVFPAVENELAALELTPFEDVSVVILGQDPYHGSGQAHGLSFSVPQGVAIPPSLRNIYKELESDLGIGQRTSGDLGSWAQQGVLLLNTTLTVRSGEAGSHRGRGWECFTDAAIEALSASERPIAFILWGANARSKAKLIDSDRHLIIESAHPSPLSAHRGFFGSKPFSRANDFLISAGREPIDW